MPVFNPAACCHARSYIKLSGAESLVHVGGRYLQEEAGAQFRPISLVEKPLATGQAQVAYPRLGIILIDAPASVGTLDVALSASWLCFSYGKSRQPLSFERLSTQGVLPCISE